jgi:hypothetical protein
MDQRSKYNVFYFAAVAGILSLVLSLANCVRDSFKSVGSTAPGDKSQDLPAEPNSREMPKTVIVPVGPDPLSPNLPQVINPPPQLNEIKGSYDLKLVSQGDGKSGSIATYSYRPASGVDQPALQCRLVIPENFGPYFEPTEIGSCKSMQLIVKHTPVLFQDDGSTAMQRSSRIEPTLELYWDGQKIGEEVAPSGVEAIEIDNTISAVKPTIETLDTSGQRFRINWAVAPDRRPGFRCELAIQNIKKTHVSLIANSAQVCSFDVEIHPTADEKQDLVAKAAQETQAIRQLAALIFGDGNFVPSVIARVAAKLSLIGPDGRTYASTSLDLPIVR